MEADAICNSICFESKSRPQSDRIAFILRQIIHMTSTMYLVCCTEASSMAPLTSRPGRCGKSQLFHQSSTNTQIHFFSPLLYWLQHAFIYIYTNKCVTHLLFQLVPRLILSSQLILWHKPKNVIGHGRMSVNTWTALHAAGLSLWMSFFLITFNSNWFSTDTTLWKWKWAVVTLKSYFFLMWLLKWLSLM